MKLLRNLACIVLLGCAAAYGVEVPQQAVIANETGLAFNNTYPLDISNAGKVSMQVDYTSTTFASKTFADGTESTGSLTVVSFTALSSATANCNITVVSTQGVVGQALYVAGTTLLEGRDFTSASSIGATACSLATAMNAKTVFLSTCTFSSGVVGSTAPAFGSFWNQGVASSTPAALSVSNGGFTGGRDNQTFAIGSKIFKANVDFFPLTSTSVTATNIATAITASSTTTNVVAQAQGTLVTATSTIVGVSSNFAMASSSDAALSLSGPKTVTSGASTSAMTGGTNSAYTNGSANITIASHGFTKALSLLYSTGTVVISGLTNQTTYFAIPIDANTIQLATTSALAQAGTGVVIGSSSTQTTAHTYTLAPLAISGTPSFKWQVSNDQTNWADLTANTFNITVSSVTMTSYTFGGATTVWDPGPLDYNWLRLNVIAPTQGGILLKAFVAAKP